MKTILANVALITCLLSPMMESGAATTTYSGNTDSVTITAAGGPPSLYNIDFGYTWADMLLPKPGSSDVKEYNATSITWNLTGPSGFAQQSGTIADARGVISAAGTLPFYNLSAGTYTMTLTGIWANVTLSGVGNSHDTITQGDVTLLDPTVTRITTPVPEPESYAMLLAGLGLVGTIAIRRRNQNNA